MLPRLSHPVASTSKLAPPALALPRRRSFHLSPFSPSPPPPSSSSSDPQPQPKQGPRHGTHTSTIQKPRKTDSQRKAPEFKPTILDADRIGKFGAKERRKILMDEFTRFFPSQRGEIERPGDFDSEPLHIWNPKENGFAPLIHPPDDDFLAFRRVTAKDVANRIVPPVAVTMLSRDWVDDHLYNPNYGYFSSPNLEIYTSPAFDIPSYKTGAAFMKGVAARYAEYRADEKKLERERNTLLANSPERRAALGITQAGAKGELFPEIQRRETDGWQIWHTPTELFKPWYGRTMARAIVSDYKLKHFPYDDLVIFEMGAGNGTLMCNVLDYIRDEEPEVYEHTSYRIIEITDQLAEKQLAAARENGHHGLVEIINKSIFDWDEVVSEPCFFLGMEVLDNFAHDMIRYDLLTGLPLQAVIITDPTGDFDIVYEPVTDPLIARFLALRALLPPPHNASPAMPPWLARSPLLRWLKYTAIPFTPNLSKPEWLPTKALMFLEMFREKFPKGRLLLADFTSLEEGLEGYNAPVVQTRQVGETIPVRTIMVRHGFFDIFYPTDFPLLLSLHHLLSLLPTSLPPPPPAILYSPLRVPHVHRLDSLSDLPPLPPSALPPSFFNSHPPTWPPGGVPSVQEQERMRKAGAARVWTHREFLDTFGEPGRGRTETRDGEDVMRRWYRNAGVLF